MRKKLFPMLWICFAVFSILLFLMHKLKTMSSKNHPINPIKEQEKIVTELVLSHQNTTQSYHRLLVDVSDLYLFVRGWTDAPPEFVEPFCVKLQEMLSIQGVIEFIPVPGQLAPEGCQKIPAPEHITGIPKTVVEVLEIGLKLKENIVLKKPVITVIPDNEST